MADECAGITIGDEIELIKTINSETQMMVKACIVRRKQAKVACDEDNIIKECLSNTNGNNLTETDLRNILKQLVHEKHISKKITSGKITYAPVKDSMNKKNIDVQGKNDVFYEEALSSDFEDFKRFVTKSLAKLNMDMETLQNDYDRDRGGSHENLANENRRLKCLIEGKDTIIEILRDEIKFLRHQTESLVEATRQNQSCVTDVNSPHVTEILMRQLDDKQDIIKSLLQSPKCTNEQTLTNDNSKKRASMKVTTLTDTEDKITIDIPPEIEKKRNVCIIGDSIINGINPNGFKKNMNVKVKPYGGATSEDLIDFIKPTIRKKPDDVIIHIGTNDLTNNSDTIKNLEQVIQYISHESPDTNTTLSSITTRDDKKRPGLKS